MKKRTLFVVTLITAVSLLAYLAFASGTEETGYDLFKSVLKSEKHFDDESGQVSGQIKIKDNGVTILSVEGNLVGHMESQEMSGNLNLMIDTYEKSLQFYGLENTFYLLDTDKNDVYIGKGQSEEMYTKHEMKSEPFDERSEAIVDAIVGDLAYEFELLSDTDGTTDVKFELTKDEMPVLLNLITSMSQNHDHDFNQDESIEAIDPSLLEFPLFNELSQLEVEMTELVSDIEVEYLQVTLDLNAQKEVEGFSFGVEISGLDENGTSHLISVEGQLKVEAGLVNIQKINPEEYNVYELPEEEIMNHQNR